MLPHIQRIDLLALLSASERYALTLLVAPAGSGKSMLLEQWQEQIPDSRSNPIVLACSLNEKHNHFNSLFTTLFDQLKANIPLWDAPFFKLFKDDSEVDIDTVADLAINALNQTNLPIFLVFDDFHLIKNTQIHRTFEKIVHRAPKNAHIVISSRSNPAFSIVKLKLNGKAQVIDSNDLKMSEEEIVSLNQSLGNDCLSHNQITHILKQTEGWFVGTKLALLAYHKAGEKGLESFGGSQPELLNFFGHEVLSHLNPEQRKFLMATAVCGTFSLDLCEQALGMPFPGIKLDEAIMQELFLIRDLDREGWYRYHPLLQEFLLKQMELEFGHELYKELNEKVARYYINNNEPDKGVEHAKRSGNEDFALASISNACQEWFKEGDLELMLDALSGIPDQSLIENPQLLLHKLNALCFTRRFNQASYYLNQLLHIKNQIEHINNRILSANSGPNTPNRLSYFDGYYRFFDFLLKLFQSDAEVLESASLYQENFIAVSEELEAFRQTIQAYSMLCRGQLDNAFKLASEARITLQRLEHHLFASFANPVIVLCDRYLGRGIEAVTLMHQVFTPIQTGKHTQRWINLATGMMVVEYEQNNTEEAESLLEQLIPVINHACATEAVSMLYLHGSRLLHGKGDFQKASRMLDQLERILSLGDYPRFRSLVIHEKMRQAFLSNDTNLCNSLFDQYQLEAISVDTINNTRDQFCESTERLALTTALWLIKNNKISRAYSLIEALALFLDKNRVKTRALIARCHLVVLTHYEGHLERALNQLRKLVHQYGLVCFSRTVFDETPGLSTLFEEVISERGLIVPNLFEQTFSGLINQTSTNSQTTLILNLTEKEQDIFDLLSTGMSNTEISEQADIALSTTKWHLKNIYTKLGVDNRASAIKLALQSSLTNH